MSDKYAAVFLTALFLGALVVCGVVVPILNFLIAGLWPYKEVVSLVLVALLVFAIVNGQTRKTLTNLVELSRELPEVLDTVLNLMHRLRRFRTPGEQASTSKYKSDSRYEQGIPMQRYYGSHEERW